jgi:hypothetical protein
MVARLLDVCPKFQGYKPFPRDGRQFTRRVGSGGRSAAARRSARKLAHQGKLARQLCDFNF